MSASVLTGLTHSTIFMFWGCLVGDTLVPAYYDPQSLKILRSSLEAWAALRPDEKARSSRTLLAARILELAAADERNPDRLRIGALVDVVTFKL